MGIGSSGLWIPSSADFPLILSCRTTPQHDHGPLPAGQPGQRVPQPLLVPAGQRVVVRTFGRVPGEVLAPP
ncbi:hypothetical protein ACIBG4_00195 [Nonomuraea sp. NPDC050383]|uniref:hypothetical protein n=1 Tax=Nonomuraea sp. NPDC050383 TaxID=3364362 RepID=UPI0037B004C6